MTALTLIRNSARFEELAEVIGRDAVAALCASLGGTRTYVPRTMQPDHPIAAAIGLEPAQRLAEYFHGTTLNPPQVRRQRQRALQLLALGDLTVKEVALEVGFSERRVYQLRREIGNGAFDPSRPIPPGVV